MLKVGVIDSGANPSQLGIPENRFCGVNLCAGHQHENKAGVGVYLEDHLNHGTPCIGIIDSYSKNLSFFIAKILDRTPIADEDLLIEAIRQCLDAGVNIINISLGIACSVASDRLIRICDEAYERNVPVIAAAHNDSKICFPAYYSKVFGVGHLSLPDGVGFIHMERSPVEFFVNGYFHFRQQHYTGSSFSCPKLTGEALLILEGQGDLTVQQLKNALIERSIRSSMPPPFVSNDYSYERMTFFDRLETEPLAAKYLHPEAEGEPESRVLILPLNDPILSPLAEVDLSYLNGRRKISWGAHSYGREHMPALISGGKMYAQFDTLAIGNLAGLLNLYNRKAIYHQLQALLDNGKDFWVFDTKSFQILDSVRKKDGFTSRIRYPAVSQDVLADFRRFRYLPVLKVPVIAVMAVGGGEALSTQGIVQQHLLKAGYVTAYISPAPHGMLMGACFCVPLSDPRTVSVGEEQFYAFLQQLNKATQAFLDPDIILTGIPGAVLPDCDPSAPSGGFAAALQFLYGMAPDSLIIAVSEDSRYDNVIENLRVAQAYTKADLLCFLFRGNEPTQKKSHLIEKLSAWGSILWTGDPHFGSALVTFIQQRFSAKQHLS